MEFFIVIICIETFNLPEVQIQAFLRPCIPVTSKAPLCIYFEMKVSAVMSLHYGMDFEKKRLREQGFLFRTVIKIS